MPPAKKEVKAEEPLFVDEEGSYVHEAEQAKYRGGVRRYTFASGTDGAAAGPGGAAASTTAGAGGGAAGGKTASPSPTGKGGNAATNASSTAPPAASSTTAAPVATAGAASSGAAVASASAAGGSDGLALFRHGRGVYTCPTFTYDGDWEEDTMHGSGTLAFTATGNTYRGAFARGCFAGEGTYTWKEGAVYVGQWRASRMHGLGVYTDAQGHVWRGRYFNGTGPGLIRLYPTLEPAEGVAVRGTATPSAATTASHATAA